MAMGRFLVVRTPTGEVVLRARPRGIGAQGVMQPFARYPRQLLGRWVRRDRGWSIVVCRYVDDPFGPPLYAREVESRAQVSAAFAETVALARAGQLPPTGAMCPPPSARASRTTPGDGDGDP